MELNERKEFFRGVERFLVRFRVLSISITVWSGWVMTQVVQWALSLDEVTMQHSAIIAAILTPIAAIQKFALDFALDGKINDD